MPKGIEVVVEDGTATIDFVDRTLKGEALHRLIKAGGRSTVKVLTREGPRRLYRVPEGNAREAGLLDVPADERTGIEREADEQAAEARAAKPKRGPGRPRKDQRTDTERFADEQAAAARAELAEGPEAVDF